MLFHPHSDLLWDTWLVKQDGLYYLFYIRLLAAGPPHDAPLTMGAGWDAIDLATSPDLLHWTEQGTVLEKDAEAPWLGTGMIHRVGGQYVLNFSEERPSGRQVISFATSPDLRTWQRLSQDHDLRPDGRLYQADAATTEPGLFPSYEAPEHLELGGRHYALFSTNTTAGARYIPGDPLPQGGTYYVVSESAAGP